MMTCSVAGRFSTGDLLSGAYTMQDTNPIRNQIADLQGRLQSLRGYL